MQAILYDYFAQKWVEYVQPIEILKTNRLDQILPILDKITAFTSQGFHAVGYLTYEASTAFDFNFETYGHIDIPLCYFAIYNKRSDLSFPTNEAELPHLKWQASIDKEYYENHIQDIKKHIQNGTTYQVNYTYRLFSEFNFDSRNYFFSLLGNQKTNLAAFLDTDDFSICSLSPELFFELNGNHLVSKPMKGTVARGRFLEEDQAFYQWLKESKKNCSENTMIVDMIRNDMGRISQIGSINVEQLHEIERYKTAFQMISTVKSLTTESISNIFKAMFPCASITGAPKIKTMEVIKQLETTPRKIYTGCIGYMLPQRQARFNVSIRTVLIHKKKQIAEFGVGGGIVWDSNAQEEFKECQTKAKLLHKIENHIELLETMLFEPDKGIFLLEYHLDRFINSAHYFLLPLKKDDIKQLIHKATSQLQQKKCLIRMIYNTVSGISFEQKDYQEPNKTVRICLSKEAANSDDYTLYHKLTQRTFYNKAFHNRLVDQVDDVIILNEKNEITESTICNIVLVIDGIYYTPKITSGLLPGTFRQNLLEKKYIKEKVLLKDDLNKAESIYLINSVRKWQKAIFIN